MIAAAAFLLSIGSAAAAKAVLPETKWFHVNPSTGVPIGEAMEDANCEAGPGLCSIEFILDSNGNPSTEVDRAYGTPSK